MLKDYRDELDCALGDPCDYDHTCRNHKVLSQLKHNAMQEIEALKSEIDKLEKEIRLWKLTYRKEVSV